MDGEGGCCKTPRPLLDTPSYSQGQPFTPPQRDPTACHSPSWFRRDRAQGGSRLPEVVHGWVRLSTASEAGAFPFPHPPDCPQHWPPPHWWPPHKWASGSQAFPVGGDLPQPLGDSQGSLSQCFSASYPPTRCGHPETKAPLEMNFLVLSTVLPMGSQHRVQFQRTAQVGASWETTRPWRSPPGGRHRKGGQCPPAILTICSSLLPLPCGPPLKMPVLGLSEPHVVSVPTQGCPLGGTLHLHHHSHVSCRKSGGLQSFSRHNVWTTVIWLICGWTFFILIVTYLFLMYSIYQ